MGDVSAGVDPLRPGEGMEVADDSAPELRAALWRVVRSCPAALAVTAGGPHPGVDARRMDDLRAPHAHLARFEEP
jgi:hypothetical protein